MWDCSGLIWLRIVFSGKLLWKRQRIFGFHKRKEGGFLISWVTISFWRWRINVTTEIFGTHFGNGLCKIQGSLHSDSWLTEHTVGNHYFIISQSSGSAILEGHATFPWPLWGIEAPLWQVAASLYVRCRTAIRCPHAEHCQQNDKWIRHKAGTSVLVSHTTMLCLPPTKWYSLCFYAQNNTKPVHFEQKARQSYSCVVSSYLKFQGLYSALHSSQRVSSLFMYLIAQISLLYVCMCVCMYVFIRACICGISTVNSVGKRNSGCIKC